MTYSRKQYMDREVTHEQYYGQFASPGVIAFVVRSIGPETIRASTDPHMNDIPLHRWDQLNDYIRELCLSKMGDANGAVSTNEFGQRRIGWSLSDGVCIAKQAARQWKEQA